MYKLEISDIAVDANIGVTEQERALKQRLEISIVISFNVEPLICESDNIHDGLCYASAINTVNSFVSNNTFCTIEKLTKSIFIHLSQSNKIAIIKDTIDYIEISVYKNCVPQEFKANGNARFIIAGKI